MEPATLRALQNALICGCWELEAGAVAASPIRGLANPFPPCICSAIKAWLLGSGAPLGEVPTATPTAGQEGAYQGFLESLTCHWKT